MFLYRYLLCRTGHHGTLLRQLLVQHRAAVRCRTAADRGASAGRRLYSHHGLCGQHYRTVCRLLGHGNAGIAAADAWLFWHFGRRAVAVSAGDDGQGAAADADGRRTLRRRSAHLGSAVSVKVYALSNVRNKCI